MRHVFRYAGVAALFSAIASAQTTWHVDDDASGTANGSPAQPFADVASAIAAAVPGDTILVADGVYAGFAFGGKNVVVRSANGKAGAIVSGSSASGFLIEIAAGEGPGAVLDGFTVVASDYALWVYGASPTVRNCDFLGTGVLGLGVRVETPASGPGALFEDVTVGSFEYQGMNEVWTGLEVSGPGTYRRCRIVDNVCSFAPYPGYLATGPAGAGLKISPEGYGLLATSPVFEDCVVADNVGGAAVGNAGGFGGAFGDAVYRRCVIVDNVGGYGFALADPPGGAPGYGGGAGVLMFRTLADCVVARNVGGGGDAVEGFGGVHAASYPGSSVVNCTIVENSGRAEMGSLWRNCIVRDNGPPGIPVFVLPGAVVAYCNVSSPVAGVGNFDAPESFVNAATGDYRLAPDSPSVDAGDPTIAGSTATDLDGEPRVFGGRIDVGADEYTGALVGMAAAAGNVGDATGANGPFDVLKLDGSAGFSGRTVDAALGAPLTFEVAAPPGVAAPFSYVLCGMFGVPGSADAFPAPFGTFLFLPSPVDPAAPGFFTLASDVVFPLSSALVPTGPAPLAVAVPGGVPFPLTITLQAAVAAGGPAATDLRVSNAVVLRVY